MCDNACNVDKCFRESICLNPRCASRLQVFVLVGTPGNQGILFGSPISEVSYCSTAAIRCEMRQFHGCTAMIY